MQLVFSFFFLYIVSFITRSIFFGLFVYFLEYDDYLEEFYNTKFFVLKNITLKSGENTYIPKQLRNTLLEGDHLIKKKYKLSIEINSRSHSLIYSELIESALMSTYLGVFAFLFSFILYLKK
jgi:hypothetical protein